MATQAALNDFAGLSHYGHSDTIAAVYALCLLLQ